MTMSSGLVPDIISGPMDHHLRMISRTPDGSHVVRASTLLLVLAVLSSVHTVHTTYTHTDIHYALRASVCYALGDGVLPMRCHQDSGSPTYGSDPWVMTPLMLLRMCCAMQHAAQLRHFLDTTTRT